MTNRHKWHLTFFGLANGITWELFVWNSKFEDLPEEDFQARKLGIRDVEISTLD